MIRIRQAKKAMRVSSETIYQWIYKDAKKGGDLYTYLIGSRKKRRKQHKYASLRGHIPERIDIDQRGCRKTLNMTKILVFVTF